MSKDIEPETLKPWPAKAWIIVIVALFGVVSATHSIVTPIFEASDELWHYPVVQHIAAGQGLPVQTPPERAGLWKQEASQPPLYYALAGLLTAWVDSSDLTTVLRPNPHAAIGVVTADGNINMVTHDPTRKAWPWRGTVLAVHLARLLSVVLGAATVYLTYRLGQAALPNRPEIALGAAALTAFTPMFTFISGSVNNDNLVIPLCALALLLMIRLQAQAHHSIKSASDWMGWLILGTVIGLATLSKVNAIALASLAALSGAWVAWQRRSWRYLFAAGLAIGLPVLVLAGWWFWRNVNLYGDLLGFELFTPYFTRAIPADLTQIWAERTSFLYGYWGNMGGLNLPIPHWAFVLLNSIVLLAALGLIKWVCFMWVKRNRVFRKNPGFLVNFPLLLIIAWGLIVFAGWLTWTRTTWSSQGRLVFSAIPCYSILIVAGLAQLLPRRAAPFVLAVLGAALALFAAALPFTLIAPAYAHPLQLTAAQLEAIPQRVNVTFGDALVLLGYDAPVTSAKPGDLVPITLYWQALKPAERDYSIFVHLLDESDIEAQDKGPAYPGRGNLPATTLGPGQTWAETWLVPVRSTAYTPASLRWEIGLCDPALPNCPRLPGTDSLQFGQIALARPQGAMFNPVSYNLGDQLELIGFDMDRRVAAPGETIHLNLFWRALAAPARDYTVFTHVLQPPQTLWASQDLQPTPHTLQWQPGQTISDTYPLTLKPDTPPGIYEIEIGVYFFTGPSDIERLKVLARDGSQQQDFILLSKIRVAK